MRVAPELAAAAPAAVTGVAARLLNPRNALRYLGSSGLKSFAPTMTYVRLSGHIEELAPDSFVVVVSATSERTSERGAVLTSTARSLDEAQAKVAQLRAKLTEKMIARGHVVLDLELD